MANSVVNSPNSTFETEDTIKMNNSIISSASTSNFHNSMVSHNINDQFYQYDSSMINGPFNPLPPPPINMSHSTSFSNSNSHSNSNHFNSSSRASSADSSNITQEFVSAGAMGPNTTVSDYFNGNEYSIPNSSHYSIFSNQQAMNSTISFHNDSQNNQQIFKLNMDSTSDILNDYSISNSQNTDLMYNLTEFELGNPSLESIPDSMLHHNQPLNGASFSGLSQSYNNPNSQAISNPNDPTLLNYALPSYNSTNDITQYPYTPTISDAYTPTVSETSSYTPNSSSNNNPTSNTNVDVATEEFSIRAPVPLSLKSSSYSSSSPNLGSHKITKKPSIARMNSNSALNNKKSLVISTQITNPSSNTPISESSPQMLGISPLCNKYKGLDIYHQPSPISARSISNASICSNGSNTSTNTPNKSLMPPLNTFRHNSEVGPTSNYYETPRRKTFPNTDRSKPRKQVTKKASKGALVINANQPGNTTASLNGNDVPSEGKPKKYTRRRLLPRSKNGCWICRIKHLKCDEVKPVCTSCSKFGVECDYSPTKPGYVTDKQLRKEKLMSISMVRKQKQKSVGGIMLDQDEVDYPQSAAH